MKKKIIISLTVVGLLLQACRTQQNACYFSSGTTAPINSTQGDGGGYSILYGDTISYFFTCKDQHFIFRLPLLYDLDSMQDEYQQLDPTQGRWHMNVYEDPFIELVILTARQITRAAETYNIDHVELAVALVQSFPYDEGITCEQKVPSQCLLQRTGKCADTSLLLATILCAMREPCILLVFPEHLMVGVYRPSSQTGLYFYHNEKRFYAAETVEIKSIGECRDEYKNISPKIIDFCS